MPLARSATHDGPWPSALPAAPPDPTGLDDAAVLDAFATAIHATRDPRTGACVHDGRPSAGAALFALAHATARGDAGWASTAADTIDALHGAAPGLDDDRRGGVRRRMRTASIRLPGSRIRPSGCGRSRGPSGSSRCPRGRPSSTGWCDGLRSAFRRDDGHWRPWTGSPRLVLVDASARACRALLAAADALDRPDLAARGHRRPSRSWRRVAYSRGSGVSHTIADGHARGPVLLDDAMLLAHALLDADAWRADPVYRDLAEELVRTSLARLQEPSGAIRDRVAALAGAGQVGRLADAASSARWGMPLPRDSCVRLVPRRRRAGRGGPPHPRRGDAGGPRGRRVRRPGRARVARARTGRRASLPRGRLHAPEVLVSPSVAPATAALRNVATRLRIDSVRSTTKAGSGHPSTCCSAADIVAVLFFGEMRYDPKDPAARRQRSLRPLEGACGAVALCGLGRGRHRVA